MNNLIDLVRQQVVGDDLWIDTAFGRKPLVYADYTASGRALGFIEDYIREEVLPGYANTHTEASYTGARTTRLRESARQVIREAVNARPQDQVIFCGSGATAAIHKFLNILELHLPAKQGPAPLVILGPYEHHSNELPWRESHADLEVIPLDKDGQMDLLALERVLKNSADRPLVVGSFSAASNVTGVKTDIPRVHALLKAHGALSCWDYAAAAPYQGINMQTGMDAVFISPHKFPGGPGTPGVLVVNGDVMNNAVPANPGGGTVSFVTPSRHTYVTNKVRREEGGTPGIVESIRAGLVFKLQQDVGVENIERCEAEFVQQALARWQAHPGIDILGNPALPRLAIFSLRIKDGAGYLPYGFVVALLNDLFGIQARGGCSCAGPYGHALLGLDEAESQRIELQVLAGDMSVRPGWVRLGFNYFFDEPTVEYLLRAVELIAENGKQLLPMYECDRSKGLWRPRQAPAVAATHDGISQVNFLARAARPATSATVRAKPNLEVCLEEAMAQMNCRQASAAI